MKVWLITLTLTLNHTFTVTKKTKPLDTWNPFVANLLRTIHHGHHDVTGITRMLFSVFGFSCGTLTYWILMFALRTFLLAKIEICGLRSVLRSNCSYLLAVKTWEHFIVNSFSVKTPQSTSRDLCLCLIISFWEERCPPLQNTYTVVEPLDRDPEKVPL